MLLDGTPAGRATRRPAQKGGATPALLPTAAPPGTIRRVDGDAACSPAAWFALVVEAGALPVVRPSPAHPRPRYLYRAAYRWRRKSRTAGPS